MKDRLSAPVVVTKVSVDKGRMVQVFGPFTYMAAAMHKLSELQQDESSAQWEYDIVRLRQT